MSNEEMGQQAWAVDEEESEIPSYFSRQYRRIKKQRRETIYNSQLTAQPQDPATTNTGAPDIWNNVAPNVVISSLSYPRAVIAETIPFAPKDAFWVFSQIPSWVTWLPNQIGYVFGKIASFLPFLGKIVPYLPFVGTVAATIETGITFYQEKNKNFSSVLKFITDFAAFTLLSIATGLMIWGSAMAIATIVPYLLIAATAIIATVGLIRTGIHLYKAFKDPANRTQHLINATKELLHTFIQAASIVFLFFGVQMGHQLAQFSQTFDLTFVKNAAALYAQLPTLTNITLIATGLLALEGITKGINAGFNKIGQGINHLASKSPRLKKATDAISNRYNHCKNYLTNLIFKKNTPKTQDEIQEELQEKKQDLIASIEYQLCLLNKDIASSPEPQNGTSYIAKKLHEIRHPNDRRNQKIELLTKTKAILEQNSIEMTGALKKVEKEAILGYQDSFFTKPTGVYQSFFRTQSKTEKIMQKTFKFAEENSTALSIR